MKQKIEYSSPEVISMEEYLAKEKESEKMFGKSRKETYLREDRHLYLLKCIYKRKIKRRTFYFGPSFMISSSSSFVTRKAS